jgi:hypothetical protein
MYHGQKGPGAETTLHFNLHLIGKRGHFFRTQLALGQLIQRLFEVRNSQHRPQRIYLTNKKKTENARHRQHHPQRIDFVMRIERKLKLLMIPSASA